MALAQSERYGTPLGRTLRVIARKAATCACRRPRRRRPPAAKLTVPMILFFLPVLFVVILGPAAIRVMGIHSGMARGGAAACAPQAPAVAAAASGNANTLRRRPWAPRPAITFVASCERTDEPHLRPRYSRRVETRDRARPDAPL